MARDPNKPRYPPRTSQEHGPFCGRPRAHGKGPCKQPAGFRTNHPGQGACFKHGGNRPITTGRYSNIRHVRLRERMDELAALEANVLDLEPEANLLRALTAEYIDNYEEFVDALLAWYREPDVKVKPRRIMDLSDASSLIESISRIVERIHKIQSEGAISLLTFKRVTEQMGLIVARHVKDDGVIERIDKEWGTLALDAKTTSLAPTLDDDSDDEEEE